MIGLLHLQVAVFGRSLTTTPGGLLAELGGRLTAYEHSITATAGFESCQLSFLAHSIEEALIWSERLLCPLTAYGPNAEEIWDGLVVEVEIRAGNRARAYSLDPVANRVRVRYTTALGTPAATAAASNTASQARYGVRDGMLSVGTVDLAGATGLRDAYLASRALPRARPATEVRLGATDDGPITVNLLCAGRYSSLDWVMLERTDSASETTTAQVATLIGSVSPGIGATNQFIGSSTSSIETTGVAMTRRIDADTTYRQAIEKRLSAGSAAGQRYSWGVYEDRVLRVRTWAGATPSRIGYVVSTGEARVATGNGDAVGLWRVRPDAMVQDAALVPVGPLSGSVDQIDRYYIERTTFRAGADGLSLTLEPEASSSLDARIVRVS